jgi:hypothetical protein
MLDIDQEPMHHLVGAVPRLQVRGPAIQVLFAEARRRRRRRRLLAAALSLMLTGAAAAGMIAGGGGNGATMRRSDGKRPAVAAKPQASRLALPAVQLAWLDYNRLMIGDPATGARHAGPAVDASPTAPLVSAAGQLFWADANRDGAPIRDYSLATGKIRYLPRGEAVFASLDGRHLYIARSSRVLFELPADGSGRPVVLRAPVGWHMSGLTAGWIPTREAAGIIVYSSANLDNVLSDARAGLWNPATGRVRIIGTGIWIFGAYTPATGHYSLLAWAPANREFARDDTLRITNSATGATVVVRSPLHHGFVASGAPAFSPGGRQMAVFVRTAPLGSSSGVSRLAIVDTSTGAVRLVPGTSLFTTEDAFWAIWLPGSQRVLAGAVGSAYLVDARTLAFRSFRYFGDSSDGFTAVVLPFVVRPSAASRP